MEHYFTWQTLFDIAGIISIALNVEAVIRTAAVKRGYKNVTSLCDRIADVLGFFMDIITGIFARRNQQPPETKP